MISWNKSMNMRIRYHTSNSRRNSNMELRMEYVMNDDRISHPMKIILPSETDVITVDAEAMKRACEKILALEKI